MKSHTEVGMGPVYSHRLGLQKISSTLKPKRSRKLTGWRMAVSMLLSIPPIGVTSSTVHTRRASAVITANSQHTFMPCRNTLNPICAPYGLRRTSEALKSGSDYPKRKGDPANTNDGCFQAGSTGTEAVGSYHRDWPLQRQRAGTAGLAQACAAGLPRPASGRHSITLFEIQGHSTQPPWKLPLKGW